MSLKIKEIFLFSSLNKTRKLMVVCKLIVVLRSDDETVFGSLNIAFRRLRF